MIETTQTESFLIEKIVSWIQNNKKIQYVVRSFISNPTGTFLLDLENHPSLHDIFLETNERFPAFVKAAIVEYLKPEWNWDADINKSLKQIDVQLSKAFKIPLNQLGPEYENKPIEVEALVTMMQHRETYTKSCQVFCKGCSRRVILTADRVSKELPLIPRCINKECDMYNQIMTTDIKTQTTGYIRMITIEEPIEEAKHSSPVMFECEIRDKDVERTYMGMRVNIVGNFRSIPNKKGTNDIVIQAINVIPVNSTDTIFPTEEQLKLYKQMSKRPEYHRILCNSIEPEVHGNYIPKMAVLLSLVRGKKIGRVRGNIHTLLVGDPSTAKTKITKFVTAITQKSSYVNGRMASGPGLTVGMDQTEKGRLPRAGPIPLCDDGFVSLDEMGRIKKDDLSALHESMESGTITFAKAGYHFTLKADTTIIGAANPIGDTYDIDSSVVDNVGLPDTILTRCDNIVNMRDIPNSLEDTAIINHIVKVRGGKDLGIEFLGADEMTGLLNHIRKIDTIMTEEAEKKIMDFYLSLRTIEQKPGSHKIVPRTFEALYRISTAFAKLDFSDKILPQHADEAILFYKETLHTFGMNTEKEGVQLGLSEQVNNKESAFVKIFRQLQNEEQEEMQDRSVVIQRLHKDYQVYFRTEEEADDYFEKMAKLGKVIRKKGKYRMI